MSRHGGQSEQAERAARGVGASTQEARWGSRAEFKRNSQVRGGGKPLGGLECRA